AAPRSPARSLRPTRTTGRPRRTADRPPRRVRVAAQGSPTLLHGWALRVSPWLAGVFHLLGEQIQRVVIDLSPLAGPPHTPDDLLAAERLGDPAALDDRQHRRLHRGEPPAALGA